MEGELVRAILRNDESQIVRLAASRPGLDALLIGGIIVSYHRMRQDPRGQDVTPLLVAVHFGELELCKYLIQEHVDVNAGYLHSLKPLSLALDYKHYEIAKLLIDSGADVNLPNRVGETAMEYAINEYSPVKIVEDLLAAGVDKNAIINPAKYTPIIKAVRCNNVSLVGYLLERSVDLNTTDINAFTPLGLAALKNYDDIVKMLLKKGAKVEDIGQGDIPPLCLGLYHHDGQIAKLLIKAGANIHRVIDPNDYIPDFFEDRDILTMLYLAVDFLNFEGVKVLIANGADVNSKNLKIGITPLQHILRFDGNFPDEKRKNYRRIIRILLDSGADLSVKLVELTVPQYVVCKKDWVALDEIIKTGVDVNAPLKERMSIFHFVLVHDKFELTKLCLEFGADVFSPVPTTEGLVLPIDVVARNGSEKIRDLVARHMFSGFDHPLKTNPTRSIFEGLIFPQEFVLSRAIMSNKVLLARYALEQGALITNGHAFDLKRTLHLPIVNKNHELVKLLLQHGVHLQVPYADQSTYLHQAIRFCHFESVRALLIHGACYNSTDIQGITPVKVKSASTEEDDLTYETTKESQQQTHEKPTSNIEINEISSIKHSKGRKGPLKKENTPTEQGKCSSKVQRNKLVQQEESFTFKPQSSTKAIEHEEASKKLLKDISRMFSMVRRGDAKVLQLLEARRRSEEFLCYINCINRRGNSLLAEAVSRGHKEISDGIMNLRLREDY